MDGWQDFEAADSETVVDAHSQPSESGRANQLAALATLQQMAPAGEVRIRAISSSADLLSETNDEDHSVRAAFERFGGGDHAVALGPPPARRDTFDPEVLRARESAVPDVFAAPAGLHDSDLSGEAAVLAFANQLPPIRPLTYSVLAKEPPPPKVSITTQADDDVPQRSWGLIGACLLLATTVGAGVFAYVHLGNAPAMLAHHGETREREGGHEQASTAGRVRQNDEQAARASTSASSSARAANAAASPVGGSARGPKRR